MPEGSLSFPRYRLSGLVAISPARYVGGGRMRVTIRIQISAPPQERRRTDAESFVAGGLVISAVLPATGHGGDVAYGSVPAQPPASSHDLPWCFIRRSLMRVGVRRTCCGVLDKIVHYGCTHAHYPKRHPVNPQPRHQAWRQASALSVPAVAV